MALFCRKCAVKYGIRHDDPPFICEGCGQEIPKNKTILKIVLKKLKSI